MEDKEKGISQSQVDSVKADSSGKTIEEPDLLDYLSTLYRYKFFIIICVVLPALAGGVIIHLMPTSQSTTYTYYDRKITERDFTVFLEQFYSTSNISKLSADLTKKGLNKYAARIDTAAKRDFDSITELIKFDIKPDHRELTPAGADLEKLEMLPPRTHSVILTIFIDTMEDITEAASVIRYNIEKIMPAKLLEKSLMARINQIKSEISDIEKSRYEYELSLKENRLVLEKLNNITIKENQPNQSKVLLQFDLGNKNEYLPIEYHITAVESQIISLEEQLQSSEEKFKYNQSLLELKKGFIDHIQENESPDFTIEDFLSFLVSLSGTCEKQEVNDYLSSYTKDIELLISSHLPATEKPSIKRLPKKLIKQCLLIAASSFIGSVLISFLSDNVRKRAVKI